MEDLSREQKWTLVSLGSAILAGVVVRRGIRMAWEATGDEPPPLNPLREESSWSDALLFSVATGLTVGLARLGARAVAGLVWKEEKGLPLPDRWS